MILLFLGSWRSTLIVVISIPAVDPDVARGALLLGQTLNVMTLGGLALAVGILVDDATVEIENIHRNLGMGKRIVQAILDGAAADRRAGVRLHALRSASCSCRSCSSPARRSTCSRRWRWPWCFAMMASYLLSRTLVPDDGPVPAAPRVSAPRMRARRTSAGSALRPAPSTRFERGFERLRDALPSLLAAALAHRKRRVLASSSASSPALRRS